MDYEKKRAVNLPRGKDGLNAYNRCCPDLMWQACFFSKRQISATLQGLSGSDGALLVKRSKNPSSRGWKIYNAGEGRSDGL